MPIPLVSVCIPTYNSEHFITEALESVICQSYVNFEVVILDDCSTDRTATIAHQFATRDQRFTVHINKQNLGMVSNWNRCLELAQGKYIKYLFGDDLFSSLDTLKLMVEAIEETPQTVLVSSARTIINAKSHPTGCISNFPDKFSADGHDVIRSCMRKFTRTHNLIGEPSVVMFRKDAAIRGFDHRYNQLADIEMWFHLLEKGRFVYLAEPLCSFRHHDGQQTIKNELELEFVYDLTYLFDDYLKKPYANLGRMAQVYLRYYQFYKLYKHARQGQHSIDLVRERIRNYGAWRFALLWPFYCLYSPYWRLKRIFAEMLGRD